MDAVQLTPAATFGELLLRRADDDRLALRCGDESWTWRDLLAAARSRAALMLARQASLPDAEQLHVGVLLENTMEYVAWIYGAALARATVVGINPTRRGAALAQDIRHTDCRLLVTDAERLPLVSGLDLGMSAAATILVDGLEYAAELEAASDVDGRGGES